MINTIMNNLVFVILLTLILQSCVSIYFQEPQPKNGKLLSEIPEELRGEWLINEEGVKIDDSNYRNIQFRRDTLNAVYDVDTTLIKLCDTNRLYKIKQFYVFNYRANGSPWEIIVIEVNLKGDISFYETRETTLFEKDKKLEFIEANYNIDGNDSTVYVLSDGIEGSSRFNSATFSGQMLYKTVKKIARKKNLIIRLNKDGTVFNPENEEEK